MLTQKHRKIVSEEKLVIDNQDGDLIAWHAVRPFLVPNRVTGPEALCS
ncbi:hypothetical protein SS05631_c29530 [Sinorhizobium sp. CCBAU 05631]|nr:hypothetical protein SS05631_c29530 [Sinorhizobium sp. CCBAU 05631]